LNLKFGASVILAEFHLQGKLECLTVSRGYDWAILGGRPLPDCPKGKIVGIYHQKGEFAMVREEVGFQFATKEQMGNLQMERWAE
jgi:hypothetical protein